MPTAIEIIRANLIGLPADITDITIQVIIDSSQSLHDAAIALAESAASLTAGDSESIKLGSLSISSDVSASWLAIKDNLIKRKLTNTGVIVDPNASGSGIGIGATLYGTQIPRSFSEGQFDNPPCEY